MLTIEEIKLIGKILNGEDVDFTTLKEKINLVIKQIEISEKAQSDIAEIQDKISKLGENENE